MHQSLGTWVFCGDGVHKHNIIKMQGINEQTITLSDEQMHSGAKVVAKEAEVKHKMQDLNKIHIPYDLDESPDYYVGNEENDSGLMSETPSG